MLGMPSAVGASWMHFARAARQAGHERTAQSAIMQAERYGASRAHIERAKLKWAQPGERHEALRVLRQHIDKPHKIGDGADAEDITVKTIVLHWKWVQEMGLQQVRALRMCLLTVPEAARTPFF